MSDENINICINVVTKKSIREAGDQLDKLGRQGATAGKKIEKSMASADDVANLFRRSGIALTAAFVVLTAAAVKSINIFKQFETGLINVDKVTNFSTRQLGAFGKEIDLLARRVPIGTSELLNMAQTAGQLGIEGARNILAFTETVALLTKTTDLTVDSAQKLAQLLAVSNTSVADIGRLGAVIVDLGNNFSATESQILQVSTRIAQSSTQFNLLAEDSVKLGAVIAGVGEKAEASGTAIGKSFRALNSAITEGGQPLKQLIDLTGLQREELRKLFDADPAGLLRKFAQGLSGAKDQGKLISSVLGDLGLSSDRVLRVLGPLIKNTDKVKEAFDRTSVQMLKQNALSEEAAKQFRSLASQEAFANNTTTELSKTIGSLLEPAYRSLLAGITSAANAITDFIIENQKLLKVVVATGAIVVTAMAAITLAVFQTTAAYATLAATASLAWSAILLPMLPIIAGIAAISAAVVSMIVYWEEVVLIVDKATVVFLKFVSEVLGFAALLEPNFRQVMGTVGLIFVEALDVMSVSLLGLAKIFDRIFRTDTAGAIEEFRKGVRSTIEEFKNGEGTLAAAAKSIDNYTDALEADIEIEEKSRAAIEARSEAIQKLKARQEELRNVERETGRVRTRAQDVELKQIQEQLDVYSGLAEKRKQIAKAEAEELTIIKTNELTELNRIQEAFEAQFKKLTDAGLQGHTQGIKDQLNKQLADQVKSQRDKLIATGNFIEARQAQIVLDRLDAEAKEIADAEKATQRALDAERSKQEKLAELKANVKEIEAEEQAIDLLLDIEVNEKEKEDLQLLLEEKEILRLEAQKKQFESEKNHLAALDIQRKIDAAKEAQTLKIRSDAEIRDARARAKLKTIIAQTTSEQLIGIGDNLFKAGIIQGKTAGKALKGLKTSEALINTYAGANRALSSLPFPASAIAAASVIASGLANVVTIQQQKFATGGIVQPDSTRGRGIDTIPALLSVGEEVLTANNPRHRDNISKETDAALLEAINGLRADMQNMQTIVNIDGKEVADVIQTQRFRGVS